MTPTVSEKRMSECRKYRIEGRVQGVWFREYTRQEAERLGLSGYAVNCSDGSVEVLACGEARSLEQLAEWLRDGPRLARVDAVTSLPYDGERPEGFTTG